jgi:hypothetical protein
MTRANGEQGKEWTVDNGQSTSGGQESSGVEEEEVIPDLVRRERLEVGDTARYEEAVASRTDEPVFVRISRAVVEAGEAEAVIAFLRSLMNTPDRAVSFKEEVDLVFLGYDDDPRELWGIQEVRDFVARVDEGFPYWLFFLAKWGYGLQCVTLCLLPQEVKREQNMPVAKQIIQKLFTERWVPAMDEMCEFAGVHEELADEMAHRAVSYMMEGPFRLGREPRNYTNIPERIGYVSPEFGDAT